MKIKTKNKYNKRREPSFRTGSTRDKDDGDTQVIDPVDEPDLEKDGEIRYHDVVDVNRKMELSDIKREFCGAPQFRAVNTKDHNVVDADKRILEFSLSSETEDVLRWFGFEILLHGRKNIDLKRFKNKAAFLDMHDLHKQIGVIEKVWIADKRIKVHVRFSKNEEAVKVYDDIVDGIRTKVSIGYDILDMELAREEGDQRWYNVTLWSPYEASSVSVGADDEVGFGRSHENLLIERANKKKEIDNKTNRTIKKENKMDPDELKALQESERLKAEAKATEVATATIAKALDGEQKRTADIIAIGDKFGQKDMARKYITDKKTAGEFRDAVLETYNKDSESFAKRQAPGTNNIKLEGKDAQEYSLMRALNASMHKNWSLAPYEHDVSNEIAKLRGIPAQGFFVPELQRFGSRSNIRVGQTAAVNADGGFLIDTETRRSDMIELLRNSSQVIGLGATQLRDLVGNVEIPRQITDNTVEAVAENAGATESKFTLDQVTLSPKIFTTNDSYSRLLFAQTSGDIERFIIDSLLRAMALKIDQQALSGSGAGNEAEGIRNTTGIGDVATAANGSAPTWPLVVDMETQVAIDNALAGDLAYLINSATNGKMKTTVKETGQAIYLKDGEMINGHKVALSNQLPSNIVKGASGAVLSTALFGNWRDLLIGYWGGLDLLVDETTNATTGKVRIVATQMADVAVRHPESFCEMSGIITT